MGRRCYLLFQSLDASATWKAVSVTFVALVVLSCANSFGVRLPRTIDEYYELAPLTLIGTSWAYGLLVLAVMLMTTAVILTRAQLYRRPHSSVAHGRAKTRSIVVLVVCLMSAVAFVMLYGILSSGRNVIAKENTIASVHIASAVARLEKAVSDTDTVATFARRSTIKLDVLEALIRTLRIVIVNIRDVFNQVDVLSRTTVSITSSAVPMFDVARQELESKYAAFAWPCVQVLLAFFSSVIGMKVAQFLFRCRGLGCLLCMRKSKWLEAIVLVLLSSVLASMMVHGVDLVSRSWTVASNRFGLRGTAQFSERFQFYSDCYSNRSAIYTGAVDLSSIAKGARLPIESLRAVEEEFAKYSENKLADATAGVIDVFNTSIQDVLKTKEYVATCQVATVFYRYVYYPVIYYMPITVAVICLLWPVIALLSLIQGHDTYLHDPEPAAKRAHLGSAVNGGGGDASTYAWPTTMNGAMSVMGMSTDPYSSDTVSDSWRVREHVE